MKHSSKTLAKGMAFFLVAGSACCIAGLAMGFTPAQVEAMEESGELKWAGPGGWRRVLRLSGSRNSGAEGASGSGSGSTGAGSASGSGSGSDQLNRDWEFDQSFTGVRDLTVDCGVTDCELIPYDGAEWLVRGVDLPSKFSVKQKGDELKIACSADSFFGIVKEDDNAYLAIYIPKDQVIDDLDLTVGVGSVTSLEGTVLCRELDLECGVGSAELEVDIQKEASIECGVGEVALTVIGQEQDFNYDLEVGIGSVEIGDSSFGGLADDHEIRNGADKEIDISCGVGSVTLRFAEKHSPA